jgi:hypothetical protein
VNWTPIAPGELPVEVSAWLAATPGVVRVAIDGPPCTRPDEFGATLIEPLREAGRPAVQVRAESFWRDASLRLEFGREDVESYLTWLDAAAVRREVLEPAATVGRYLPSLRDPRTNRSTRESSRPLPPQAVLLVTGTFLFDRNLPFDRTVHLAMSAAARRRRTPPDEAWTLPAHDAYDATVHPVEAADLVVKLDDPLHPALRRNR